MLVGIVVAKLVMAVLVVGAGLTPSVKPVVAGAAVTVEAGAQVAVVAAAPSGLSMKAKPPAAAVVVAGAVLAAAADVAAEPNVMPVPEAGATAEVKGEEKRVGAAAGWVAAVGAGVVEGLIPKAKPAPRVGAIDAAVVVKPAWGWVPRVRVAGVLVPKVNPPPPPVGAAGAAVVI